MRNGIRIERQTDRQIDKEGIPCHTWRINLNSGSGATRKSIGRMRSGLWSVNDDVRRDSSLGMVHIWNLMPSSYKCFLSFCALWKKSQPQPSAKNVLKCIYSRGRREFTERIQSTCRATRRDRLGLKIDYLLYRNKMSNDMAQMERTERNWLIEIKLQSRFLTTKAQRWLRLRDDFSACAWWLCEKTYSLQFNFFFFSSCCYSTAHSSFKPNQSIQRQPNLLSLSVSP